MNRHLMRVHVILSEAKDLFLRCSILFSRSFASLRMTISTSLHLTFNIQHSSSQLLSALPSSKNHLRLQDDRPAALPNHLGHFCDRDQLLIGIAQRNELPEIEGLA